MGSEMCIRDREGAAPHAREDLRLQKRGEDVLRLQLGVEAGLKAQVKDRARDLIMCRGPVAARQSSQPELEGPRIADARGAKAARDATADIGRHQPAAYAKVGGEGLATCSASAAGTWRRKTGKVGRSATLAAAAFIVRART